ncbi:hypothetical protein COP2_024724 [Malus domestica]
MFNFELLGAQKINQKNTWELNLIDHLTDIIKVEEENDAETNFQKASCILEGGVKIYSMRVDSVHSEAYKVLRGINRAVQEDEQGWLHWQLIPSKGSLMNNLGVFGGCIVRLDSSEVLGKCVAPDVQPYKSDTIDLSFAGW